MKSLAHPSFFRTFDLLLSTSNRGLKLSRWSHDGVAFERERHSFSGPNHGLTIEIVTLTRAGRRGWCLIVTKEYWWAGPDSKAFKNLRWARPVNGQRRDILEWMRAQDVALGRSLGARRGAAPGADGGETTLALVDGEASSEAMVCYTPIASNQDQRASLTALGEALELAVRALQAVAGDCGPVQQLERLQRRIHESRLQLAAHPRRSKVRSTA